MANDSDTFLRRSQHLFFTFTCLTLLLQSGVESRRFFINSGYKNPCGILDIEFNITVTAKDKQREAIVAQKNIPGNSYIQTKSSCGFVPSLELLFNDTLSAWDWRFDTISDGSVRLDRTFTFNPLRLFPSLQTRDAHYDINFDSTTIGDEHHSYMCNKLTTETYQIRPRADVYFYEANFAVERIQVQAFNLHHETFSEALNCQSRIRSVPIYIGIAVALVVGIAMVIAGFYCALYPSRRCSYSRIRSMSTSGAV